MIGLPQQGDRDREDIAAFPGSEAWRASHPVRRAARSVRGGARVLSGSMLGWGDDSSRPREALRDEVLAWIPTAS